MFRLFLILCAGEELSRVTNIEYAKGEQARYLCGHEYFSCRHKKNFSTLPTGRQARLTVLSTDKTTLRLAQVRKNLEQSRFLSSCAQERT